MLERAEGGEEAMRIRGREVVAVTFDIIRSDCHIQVTRLCVEERWGCGGCCFELSLLHRPPHDTAAVLSAADQPYSAPATLVNFLQPSTPEKRHCDKKRN
jgi:hypothetical protein